MKFIAKHTLLLLITTLLFSCAKEKEWDYEYRVVNETGRYVAISYKLASTSVQYNCLLTPDADTTLFIREDVVGHDIWDIESASLIYAFTAFDAYTDEDKFSDNLRLRKVWTGPENEGNRGVYTLHLTQDLFPISLQKYVYRIKNVSERFPVQFAYKGEEEQDGATTVYPDRSADIVVYRAKGEYVKDLYADNQSGKILGLELSQVGFTDGEGGVSSCNKYGANLRQNWKYSEETDSETGSKIGVYTLEIDETICDNRTILEPELIGYKKFRYEYRIANISEKFPFEFAYNGLNGLEGAMAVQPYQSAYICAFTYNRESLGGIYNETSTEIMNLKISRLSFVREDDERSHCDNFDVHNPAHWVYTEEMNSDGEMIGVYTLTIDETICDDRSILEQ